MLSASFFCRQWSLLILIYFRSDPILNGNNAPWSGCCLRRRRTKKRLPIAALPHRNLLFLIASLDFICATYITSLLLVDIHVECQSREGRKAREMQYWKRRAFRRCLSIYNWRESDPPALSWILDKLHSQDTHLTSFCAPHRPVLSQHSAAAFMKSLVHYNSHHDGT